MERSGNKVKGVIFCGGRGAGTIMRALAAHPQFELTVLLNAYDDGLSTGKLRDYLPGMLGPSDIRKNYTTLLQASHPALSQFLEFRFPKDVTDAQIDASLNSISDRKADTPFSILNSALEKLALYQVDRISELIQAFLNYYRLKGNFDFKDCSIGNLVFAGAFLRCESNFNLAIDLFTSIEPIPVRILNLTSGSNLVLVGLKEDGSYLASEAEIVGKQSPASILDIYLLKSYLGSTESEDLGKLSIENKRKYLKERECFPEASPDALSVLREASLIIYGPGTQHSSLFPSYLTKGIGEAIQENKKAQKIFISNIRKDNEIQSETVGTLLRKLSYYLSRKNSHPFGEGDLLTKCFVQALSSDGDSSEYMTVENSKETNRKETSFGSNWEAGQGIHLGGKVVDELVAIVNSTAKEQLVSLPYMVSIIVPGLNESKTVGKVLHDLVLLNFQTLGVAKEILFVDGGSTDGTYEISKREPSVRVLQKKGAGRGEAIRFGLENAQGNLIVFFPCDAEYDPRDLFVLLAPLVKNEFKVVFGSRAIKCVNITKRIREIYAGNILGYFASKYGGMLLSVMGLLFYNRFISDPLTGVKAFEARLLRGLNLKSKGLNLETEIIAKLGKQATFILEVPMDYHPRKKNEGKKTTFGDGILSLYTLMRIRWSST